MPSGSGSAGIGSKWFSGSQPELYSSLPLRILGVPPMAETAKLSVGRVLDKIRSTEVPKTNKMARLDEKIQSLIQETRRLRAARRRLDRA